MGVLGGILTYEKKREKIRELNLTSDVFISKVLEEPEVLEELLCLLTGNEWKICSVRSQYSIRQLATHSVILDIYAEAESGKRIHLEIQNSNDDLHLKRTRYCRSCIDTMLLDTGVKYKELPDILQIFITKSDFLKCGKAIEQNTKKYNDGVTEIYFNLTVRDKKFVQISKLQKYFLETTEENESNCFPKLVERVRFLKYGKKGANEMCEVFDEVRKDGFLSGLRIATISLLQNLGAVPQVVYDQIEAQEQESCLRNWICLAAKVDNIEEFMKLAK